MHPDAKRKLNRLLWSHRLKTLRVPITILVAIFFALGIWMLDEWALNRVLTGEVLSPPGIQKRLDIGDYSFSARLASGKAVVVVSEIRALPTRSARVSVQEEVSRILRRKLYRLIRIEPTGPR